MKKIYFLLVLGLGAAPVFSQTLFTYGNYSVSKEEFLKAYNKNKTPVGDREKSLREYLELYSRFKLKVKVAESQRLDTIQQLQYDLQNFRSQVEEGYLNDEKEVAALTNEAVERGRKDIHLLQFYVTLPDSLSSTDTSQAYNALDELAASLKTNQADYSIAVAAAAKKGVQIKSRDLGYITVFSLPYAIENLVYSLQQGQVSRVYRSKSALHIFKHAGERKSPGIWKIAQVLISVPPEPSATELAAAGRKADSIYQLAIKGIDFTSLAKEYSDDKLTYLNGGELPEFGTGKYQPDFEDKVFSLQKDGDISRPFRTGFGFHIVKRLGQRDLTGDKADETFIAGIKEQVLQDSRVDAARISFLKSIKIKTGFKKNAAVKEADLSRFADSVTSASPIGRYSINQKVIFSFTKQAIKGIDWLNFVKDYKLNTDVYKGENNAELLEKFIATSTIDYYRKHLHEFDNNFKMQMKEFEDGNMLFEIMERNVWSKAANDSAGLKKFYTGHQSDYKWNESAAIILFNCSDNTAAMEAIAALKTGKSWNLVAEESNGRIQADSGRYEIAQLQLPATVSLAAGSITDPVVNSGDNTSSFMKVLKIFPGGEQRSFEEARGIVINEYQTYLEEQWVERLKSEYPVKINEAVFQSLLH